MISGRAHARHLSQFGRTIAMTTKGLIMDWWCSLLVSCGGLVAAYHIPISILHLYRYPANFYFDFIPLIKYGYVATCFNFLSARNFGGAEVQQHHPE
jgi:D-alanyl-lipoteichoic acid acyltransferase DltB (MBOAT superfamily)